MDGLANPVTRAVTPEYGPKTMWNLRYTPTVGFGMMGMRISEF